MMSISAASTNLSMDELDSITNLQRQEAFDDATEALHNTLSKRGSLFSRKRPENRFQFSGIPEVQEQENAEEKLLKIIANQTSGDPVGNQSTLKQPSRSSRAPEQPEQPRQSRSKARPSFSSNTKASDSNGDRGRHEKRRSSSTRRQSSSQQLRRSRQGSDGSLSRLSELGDLDASSSSLRRKGGKSVSSEPAHRKSYVSRSGKSKSSRRSSVARSSSSKDPSLDEIMKSPQHPISRKGSDGSLSRLDELENLDGSTGSLSKKKGSKSISSEPPRFHSSAYKRSKSRPGLNRPASVRDVSPNDRPKLRRPASVRDLRSERGADSPPPLLPSQIHAQSSRVRIASGKEYRRQSESPRKIDDDVRRLERSRRRSRSPGGLDDDDSAHGEKFQRRPRSRSGSTGRPRRRSRSPSDMVNVDNSNSKLRNSRRSRSTSRDPRDVSSSGKGEKRPSMQSQREIIQNSTRNFVSPRKGVSESLGKVDSTDSFENAWGGLSVKKSGSLDSNSSEASLSRVLTDESMLKRVDTDSQSVSTLLTAKESVSSQSKMESAKPKKTKLDKIRELQAKCDRYKKGWIENSEDRKHLKKEVESGKRQVIALKQEIQIHKSETSILQGKLSESVQKMDEILDEQRKERAEFSTTAKDLAESRIEFAKAINDTRELRVELESLEQMLKKKDTIIADLEDELKAAKIKAEDLDSDLNFAEETVLKLEKDMKDAEKELLEYRMAAEKSTAKDGDSASKVEHLRVVRDRMEKKLEEDRERRIEEKRKKLDEKVRKFEEERKRFMANERAREEVVIKQKQAELEDSRLRDVERMDEELNDRLKSLEAEKAALQGRLKSEQLDSNVKLREKDDRIASLQHEFTQIQGQMAELTTDPKGVAMLRKNLSVARAETENLKEELETAKKRNDALCVEVGDLQKGNKRLQGEMKKLQSEVTDSKREVETWQRKSGEWEMKSGEWTDRAYLWKEKAEQLERAAKEDTCSTSASESQASADPQALLLQAALEKKKATESSQTKGSKWGVIKNLLHKRVSSQDELEAENRIEELEAMNAEQAEIIKNLRSEMIQMQANYKDKAYTDQLKLQELVREREGVELKNINLMRELELARKLETFANQDS